MLQAVTCNACSRPCWRKHVVEKYRYNVGEKCQRYAHGRCQREPVGASSVVRNLVLPVREIVELTIDPVSGDACGGLFIGREM